MKLPHFVIIGAMKSATSTLHEQLALQAGIFMSDPKEPCYFSDDPMFERGLDWYAALFADSDADELRGESSTHYAKLPDHPHTVERMQGLLPDVKIIYVMRHPVDRLVSHYIHLWTEREVDVPIDDAIDQKPQLVNYSRYAMQLEPYVEAFGRDRILPVFFDHLRTHPQQALETVCRFIGYDGDVIWNEATLSNVSAERLRRSKFREAVRSTPIFPLARKLVPDPVVAAYHTRLRMAERPTLSPATVDRVSAVFDDDLATLGDWFDTPLSCATFKAQTRDHPLEWART